MFKENNTIQFYFEEHITYPKNNDSDLNQIYNRIAKKVKLNLD